MALNARLLGRSFLSCHGLRPIYVSPLRCVCFQSQPAEIPPEEGHDERNMRLNRPQSPHMTIYKFPLPAILSISHRITGMILSGYAVTFAAASVIIWDTGLALTMTGVYVTGYIVLLCTVVATAALIYIAEEEKKVSEAKKHKSQNGPKKKKKN